VWSFVESLDLSQLYDRVLSREGEAGRPAADPAVLLSLRLYATIEGVGSAPELERLAQSDAAYRWLAGGVPLNYHGLADFRVDSAEVLDRLLTQSVTALIAEGLISLDEIVVDGTKVRANASRKSFRTSEKLIKIEGAVAERLAALKQELSSDPGASTRRRQAARERAVRDVHERAGKARVALERLQAERKSRAKTHAKDEAKKKEPRASTTDPEARSMRFPDGAIRPAYNAQIAAAPKEGVIVSIEVTDRRNDAGLAGPMVASSRSWRGSNPTQLVSLQSTRSATRCHARWRSLLSRLPAPSRTATGRAIFATARRTHKAESAGEALLAAAPSEASPSKFCRHISISDIVKDTATNAIAFCSSPRQKPLEIERRSRLEDAPLSV
jgi:transposase